MSTEEKIKTESAENADTNGKKSFAEKLNSINEMFDKKTKELKILRLLLPLIVYFLFFLIFEAVFAFTKNYIDNSQLDWFYITKVSIAASICFAALLWLLPRKVQAVCFPLSAVMWTVYGLAQICVCRSNGSMFRLKNLSTAKNAAEFADTVLDKIPVWVWIAFAVMIAAVAAADILVLKKTNFKPQKTVAKVKTASAAVLCAGGLLGVLLFTPSSAYSYHMYVYKNFTDTNSVYNMSDFYTYCFQDIKSMVTVKVNAKKNMSKITEFFDEKADHTDNEMTGIFEGKNLLVIQLESFDKYLIEDGYCPNLQKIMNESIVFENYYGMRFGAEPTFGNEVAVNTGFYATSDYTGSTDLLNAYFPYSLANMFKSQGYSANVYHENIGQFYNRDKAELVFGYEKYNSFREMTDEDIVYTDDYYMAECDDIYNQIVGGDNFMNYYITYSAHPPYAIESGEWKDDERYLTAIERHPELADKEINTTNDIYEVYSVLTDDMVELLLERMEEDGSLDDTVILFVADHANLMDLYNNSGEDYFKVQNLPCFIYSKDITPQTVEKTCSNIDLLPTLLNMFGIENPNVYIGNDIFDSESEGIAYLPSFDWKTDKCMYVNGSVVENYTDEEISKEYIDEINQRVETQIDVNNLVLYTEYFKKNE